MRSSRQLPTSGCGSRSRPGPWRVFRREVARSRPSTERGTWMSFGPRFELSDSRADELTPGDGRPSRNVVTPRSPLAGIREKNSEVRGPRAGKRTVARGEGVASRSVAGNTPPPVGGVTAMARRNPRYRREHDAERKRVARVVASGAAVCSRCGLPILPGQAWDMGHDDSDPTGRRYSGPEHSWCNRRAGGRRGRAQQLRQAKTSPTRARSDVGPGQIDGERPPKPAEGFWRWDDRYGWVSQSRDW